MAAENHVVSVCGYRLQNYNITPISQTFCSLFINSTHQNASTALSVAWPSAI
jgi:hypothetical protein